MLTENSCGLEPSTPVTRSMFETILDSPGMKHKHHHAELLTHRA